MADKRKPPEAPGGPRRKRATPTIDLKATEVPETPAEDTSAEAAPEPVAPQSENPSSEAAPSPEPAGGAAAPELPLEEPAEPETEREAAPPPPLPPRGGFGAGITGGVIGAVIVAALGGGLWYAGYIPSSSTSESDLPARIATLEKQVQALQNRPAPKLDTAALDKSVDALSQRVSKIEDTLGNLPPTDKAAASKLSALDDTVSTLSKRVNDAAAAAGKAQQIAAAAQDAVSGLKQDVQKAASAQQKATPSVAPGELDAVQKKVASLETALASARNQLDEKIKALGGDVAGAQKKIAEASAGERAVRLSLSATALRSAVASGAPYAAQLAQVKSLGADAKALAPLDRLAQRGVPSRSELANELVRLIPAMRKLAGAPKIAGSFLDRLQANAEKLVRITPVQAPSGNAPSDVLARIEAEAARADIVGALADLEKLPVNIRAPANGWIAKAKARQETLAAARSFAASAARALGKE